MSVRNIDKEYIKTDIVLGTSITVPITFSGPYTTTLNVTFNKFGRIITVTIPPSLDFVTNVAYFTSSAIPDSMITYGPCTFVYISYSAGTDQTTTLSIVNNIISIYSTLEPNTTFSFDSVAFFKCMGMIKVYGCTL